MARRARSTSAGTARWPDLEGGDARANSLRARTRDLYRLSWSGATRRASRSALSARIFVHVAAIRVVEDALEDARRLGVVLGLGHIAAIAK